MPENHQPWRLLVFGSSGAIGGAVCEGAAQRGFEVVAASRSPHEPNPRLRQMCWDPLAQPYADAEATGSFDAVCWAQGANVNDSILDFDVDQHLELYRANCLFVLKSLSDLLTAGALRPGGARLCVVSSIWERQARPQKLSYTVAKAAVGGLVRSISVDLAAEGHLINGVLPGALETPMTRHQLTQAQLSAVVAATDFGRLPDLGSVVELVCFLCSPANQSITGQSVAVDLGFSNARVI